MNWVEAEPEGGLSKPKPKGWRTTEQRIVRKSAMQVKRCPTQVELTCRGSPARLNGR